MRSSTKIIPTDEFGRPTTIETSGSTAFFEVTRRAKADEIQILSLIANGIASWKFKVLYLRPATASVESETIRL
jgi:hypothetical protein